MLTTAKNYVAYPSIAIVFTTIDVTIISPENLISDRCRKKSKTAPDTTAAAIRVNETDSLQMLGLPALLLAGLYCAT